MQHTSIQQLREFCANVAVGSGDKYLIEACRDGRNATITCSCQAGQHRQHCKHWFALMDGDVTGLLSDNTRDVVLLQVIKAGTDIDKYLEIVDCPKRKSPIWAARRDVVNVGFEPIVLKKSPRHGAGTGG